MINELFRRPVELGHERGKVIKLQNVKREVCDNYLDKHRYFDSILEKSKISLV